MSQLFQRPDGPTRINTVQINQNVLGYPVPVVMGKGKIQQSGLWVDGFQSSTVSVGGGKGLGGGKDGSQYVYSADYLAGLCDGGSSGLVGIGDVWSGQSWLQNTDTSESYAITGSNPSYTPANALNMTGDHGVGYTVALSTSQTDLTAPAPTSLATSMFVPFQRVAYISGSTGAQASGTYSVDSSNNYYFSASDVGLSIQIFYTFALGLITQQQNALIPSGLNIPVEGNLPFSANVSVVYYDTDADDPDNGTALTQVSGTPTAAGSYSVDTGSYTVTQSGTTYTVTVNRPASYTFASADLNKEVQITYRLNNSTALPAGTQTSLSFELIPGLPNDEPAALLTTSYPGAALGYPSIAKILYSPMDLGYGAQVQQNTFEVITADAWGGGVVDCNPVQCVLQVLSNPVWGLGQGTVPFPLSAIDNGGSGTWGSGNAGNNGNGALATVGRGPIAGKVIQTANTATAWFAANGFFISPVVDRQDTAASLVGRWLEAGMCAAFMSEGLMKLVPYGDTSAAGNGMVWTAPSAFVAQLDDTCFVMKEGKEPVRISSSPWTEAYNKVQIQWNNRASQYAQEVTPEEDKAAVNRYGSRTEDLQSWDFITTLASARFAGSMRVRRNVYQRNTYTFTVPFRFGHLEPMDVIGITTSHAWQAAENNTIQLVNQPVRITKIVDNPDFSYDVTCEDYIFGASQPAAFNKATSQATTLVNQYDDPGNTSAVIFGATSQMTGYLTNELWIGASGSQPQWGGCNVWGSLDNENFTMMGTITSPGRVGVLNASVPDTADPDSTDSIVVNLTAGSAPLDAFTSAQADAGLSLCFLGGEVIAYSAAALTGADQYTLNTYIRRGQMSTSVLSHASGELFMRLDGTVLKLTYDPSWAGKTAYFKFQSFNQFSNSLQDLSTLSSVTFDITTQVIQGSLSGTSVAFILSGTAPTEPPKGGGIVQPYEPPSGD